MIYIILKWIAIVIGVIIVLVLLFIIGLLVHMLREPKTFEIRNPPPPDVLPLLAFGTILLGSLEPLRSLKLPDDSKQTMKDKLRDVWGVTDRQSACSMVEDLIAAEVHCSDNSHYLPAVLSGDRAALEKTMAARYGVHPGYISDLASQMLKHYKILKRMSWLPGFKKKELAACKSINAWDYDRGGYIARICCRAGYISESECVEYLKRISQIAKNEFTSWQEYAVSYLTGRCICYGTDYWPLMFHIVRRRLKSKNSLWKQFPL